MVRELHKQQLSLDSTPLVKLSTMPQLIRTAPEAAIANTIETTITTRHTHTTIGARIAEKRRRR